MYPGRYNGYKTTAAGGDHIGHALLLPVMHRQLSWSLCTVGGNQGYWEIREEVLVALKCIKFIGHPMINE